MGWGVSDNQKRTSGVVYDEVIDEKRLNRMMENNPKVNSWQSSHSRTGNETIIRGNIADSYYKSGLRIHATDTLEVRDHTIDVELNPGVSIAIMLLGTVTGELGGQPFVLDAAEKPAGYFWSIEKVTRLKRTIQKNSNIRKVIVGMDHDFIQNDLKLKDHGRGLFNSPAMKSWKPSARLIAMAERLTQPSDEDPVIWNLFKQSIALEIVSEAFQQLLPKVEGHGEEHESVGKAIKIRDFVDRHIHEELNLKRLSTELGLSLNSLQRSFKAEFGKPLMGYIRERKLIMAHEAMDRDNVTIAQAAFLAGYNSPANFATAYKKKFGFSPSSLRTDRF